MRKFLSVTFVLVFTLATASVPANSAVKLGDSCKSVGQKTTVNGSTLTCTKSGSKLVWSKSVKADSYDAAFAAAFLAEAQDEAEQILADAKLKASQISRPPNCAAGNSQAFVSIGGDPSTGVIALIYENPGNCDLIVRASAEFYCPRGRGGNNTVISRGTLTLKARTKLFVSLNPQRYFPLVTLECAQLTGYTSNTISVADFPIRRSSPTVIVESSKYSGVFNQVDATKKANQLIKSAQSSANKIIADAKNPTLILKAWKAAVEAKIASDAQALADAKAAAEANAAVEKAAVEKAAAVAECTKSGRSCEVGNAGPGGGIVFYDAGSQQSWGRYLEFAPAGWSGAAQDPVTNWCNMNSILLTQGGIGTGKANTDLILAGCKSGAAFIARFYNGGGKDDWFLPSIEELNELCKFASNQSTGNPKISCNGSRTPLGGFVGEYWSSSEANQNFASFRGFNYVGLGTYFKSHTYYVRPIRAF
jgi:hypothetical protein